MGAGCAGYTEGLSTCEVHVKSNLDFAFQYSISNKTQKAGVDFAFVRLTRSYAELLRIRPQSGSIIRSIFA